MSKFVTVAVFQYPHEAYAIKGRLESEGIEVFLKDEFTVQTNYLSNAVGGIKLQINEFDLDKAIPILKLAGIINSENQDLKTNSNLKKLIEKIPLFKKQPIQIKAVLISGIILIFIATAILFLTAPTKEEQLASKEKSERILKEQKLEQFYLPLVDSLVDTNPKQAIEYIQKLNEVYPKNPELYDNLGVAYYDIDSIKNAIDCFEKSMLYGGYEHPRGLSNIAICKMQLEDYDGAIDNLIKASEINYDYWINLAYAYEAKGDLRSSLKYILKYIKKRESYKDSYKYSDEYKYLISKKDSLENEINKANN